MVAYFLRAVRGKALIISLEEREKEMKLITMHL